MERVQEIHRALILEEKKNITVATPATFNRYQHIQLLCVQ